MTHINWILYLRIYFVHCLEFSNTLSCNAWRQVLLLFHLAGCLQAECPVDVDRQLPNVGMADVVRLAECVPELREHLRCDQNVPDNNFLNAIILSLVTTKKNVGLNNLKVQWNDDMCEMMTCVE